MPNVLVGMRVYVPMNALTNGGLNFATGFVTEITDDDGPNGGVVCNVQVVPNRAITTLDLAEFLTGVEVVDYEGDARTLGVGNGAWPPDWP